MKRSGWTAYAILDCGGWEILVKGPGEPPIKSGHGIGPDIRFSAWGRGERSAVRSLLRAVRRAKDGAAIVTIERWLLHPKETNPGPQQKFASPKVVGSTRTAAH